MYQPKVLISGYYGFDNCGDEAILFAIIQGLKNNGIEPMVLSGNPSSTERQFGVKAYDRTDLDLAILECDGLISGGGSLLQDVTSLRSIPRYLEVIQKAQEQNKPTFFYAQGVGPMNHAPFYPIVKATLEKCTYLSVRDEDSLKFLQKVVGVVKPIDLTVDPVLFINNQDAVHLDSKLEDFLLKKPVVISVRPWENNSQIVKELTYTVEQLVDSGEYVLILPFQPVYDLPLSEDILRAFPGNRSKVFLVQSELTLDQYFDVIKKSKLMIGMRLHALIIAARFRVPFLGISYDPKTDAFLKQFDKDPTIQVSALKGEDIVNEAKNQISKLDSEKEKIGKKLEIFKERADLPLEAVVSHYMKHGDSSFVPVNR